MTAPKPTPNMIRPRKVEPVEPIKIGNAKSRRKAKRSAEQADKFTSVHEIQAAEIIRKANETSTHGQLTYRPFVGLDGLLARAAKEE